ncbi:unnamed protein product [Spirodela intermedia]|uniref:Uncharacterized protein n=1 Tax=Spirodela intermedia TaxID=51605 RepID=A0A7I8I8R8_SPIIN|nr:unnamed protein product [Spirodela intermedia]CAA6654056.1 unnamed protein product [Spirodela intermedia]
MANTLSRRVYLLNLVKVQVIGFESLPDSYIDCPNFGHVLRALSNVSESLTTYDLIISRAEFAYNSSTSCTTNMSPFEIAHSLAPCKPLDLVPWTLMRFFKR